METSFSTQNVETLSSKAGIEQNSSETITFGEILNQLV